MISPIPLLSEGELTEKTVLCRVDFNVPLQDGKVADDTRIRACLPTIERLIKQQNRVILCSHLGRPRGERVPSLTLAPVAQRLSELLQAPVVFSHDVVGLGVSAIIKQLPPAGILLLENLRFDEREQRNSQAFSRSLAGLADLFVNDAFGTLHRQHSSITGIVEHLPSSVGLLVERELSALKQLHEQPAQPFAGILGGAKVADKIGVIEALSEKLNHLFIGGAMATTFLAAKGQETGRSKIETDKLKLAAELLERISSLDLELHLPVDHVVATSFAEDAEARVSETIGEDEMALDIGPKTVEAWSSILDSCKTVFWNGPLGVFEWEAFSKGTEGIARKVASLDAFTVVGGGDSVAAINRTGTQDDFSHICTGGGASLLYLEGQELVGLRAIGESL